jgi:hypothetical protein
MPINLRCLTPNQLDDLTREIEAHKSECRSSHLAVVRAKVEATLRAEGLALSDLFLQSGRKSAAMRAWSLRSVAIPPTTRRPGQAVGRRPR